MLEPMSKASLLLSSFSAKIAVLIVRLRTLNEIFEEMCHTEANCMGRYIKPS